MNFTQMYNRLRVEMLRRIQRNTLSVSLLSRQTGLGQSHISNFLRQQRKLSLDSIDKILKAQHLDAHDLLPTTRRRLTPLTTDDNNAVPVVSHSAALFDPHIRPAATLFLLHLPADALRSLRPRCPSSRRAWQRFVAIRASATEALPMHPLILSNALVLLDRHYISLLPHNEGRRNLYAVRHGANLLLRYVDATAQHLILRPQNIHTPTQIIDLGPSRPQPDAILGRVALVINVM